MPQTRSRGAIASMALAAATASACGARSALTVDGAGAGAGGADGASTSANGASSGGSGGATSTCRRDDLSTWRTERYRDQGDYERTAVAVSGLPWVALKVQGGNVVLAKLGLDPTKGITFDERVEIPSSPVYPVALDVDDRRFVLLTTSGINWNGDSTLWRIDRASKAIVSIPIGDPPADPADTIDSAIALAGDDILLAYGRPAEGDSVVELRGDDLVVHQSATVSENLAYAVHASTTAADVYLGKSTHLHAEGGVLSPAPADPAWQVIGGLDDFRVWMGAQIRLTDGASTWSAAWPHTQISPPAVVRTDGGRAAFSLETELTAVVGYTTTAGLAWLSIESAPDAPGAGLGLLPMIEPGRLGLFYLGLEIPHPEQPLRYYGLACP